MQNCLIIFVCASDHSPCAILLNMHTISKLTESYILIMLDCKTKLNSKISQSVNRVFCVHIKAIRKTEKRLTDDLQYAMTYISYPATSLINTTLC